MTNKNKKSAANKKSKAEKAEKGSAEPSESEPAPAPQGDMFTSSQLAGLIMLGIGAQKIYELSTAFNQGTENPVLCMTYLNNEDVCSHPSFPSMILAKFHSSINLWFLTAMLVMVVWKTETYFSKLCTCLCLSPLSTTIMGVTMSQEDITRGKYIQMMLVCFALLCTTVPNHRDKIPFLTDKPVNFSSPQALCLIALFAASIFDAVRLSGGELGRENALLETATLLPEKAKILVNFWCMDKLSMALLYLFALYHFPLGIQTNFLLLVTGLKMYEGLVQLSLMVEPFHDASMIQTIVMATGLFAGVVATMAPVKTKVE